MKTFGQTLRDLRRGSGKTMGQLARELGVSVSFVSDIEHGRRPPLDQNRIRLAASLFGCDPTPLLISASKKQGTIALDVTKKDTPLREEAAASLARGWPDYTEDDLRTLVDWAKERRGTKT
jgi:transcriptional regulator with XRE-family HTH domain